jgi:hypothetical protein
MRPRPHVLAKELVTNAGEQADVRQRPIAPPFLHAVSVLHRGVDAALRQLARRRAIAGARSGEVE